MKKYIFSFLITLILLILSLFFINGLFYFNIIKDSFYRFFKILIVIISIFIGGFSLGKKCDKKGYLNGIILGLMIIVLLFIISVIFRKFQIKLLFYYLIIICSSTLGGTIGIRKRKLN